MNPLLLIWAIPLFFSIHELEEWNILNWYKKYYINLPPSTNFSIHLHILTFCFLGFLLTLIAYLLHSTFIFSLIVAFLSCFILFNTVQHIIWTIQLKVYSPGLVTALILLCVTVFVNIRLISDDLILLPFYALAVFTILPIIKTVKTKKEMTPEIRRAHTLFISLETLLKRKGI
jgi:hypothetical protein